MEPKFIHLPEKKMVGMGAKFIPPPSPDKNNMKVIPMLWGQFMGQMESIANRNTEICFGLVEPLPAEDGKSRHGEMFYIACVEVPDFSAVPAGMIQRVIPAGRFAMFTHKGKLDGLEKTMNFIYGSWVRAADVQVRNAPHMELYDHRFVPGSDESEFDILVPVR